MAKAISLHPDVYNLLIVVNINNFTVSEIRDALICDSEFFKDESETRKYIYRVIYRLTKLNLLVKSKHLTVTKIRYTKSEAFMTTNFVMKSKVRAITDSKIKLQYSDKVSISADFHYALGKEKTKYEAELAITCSEVEEFKHLMKRFPKESERFKPFYLETRGRTALLVGKINALTKVLSTEVLVA